MAIPLNAAKERVAYADEHGDQAAIEHFAIRDDTLRRYRSAISQAESDQDRQEYRVIFEKAAPKRWDEHPRLYGDWLIFNDLHLPFINVQLLDKAMGIADALNLKQLVILGDLIDFESVSKHDFGGDQFELMEELNISKEYLWVMSKRFDRIVFVRGNHDERVIKFLKRIKRMFIKETTDNECSAYHAILGVDVSKTPWQQYKAFFESTKVEISNYAKCEIEGKYIGLHPSNYSRNPPSVEKQMCSKYLKHVIGTHAHLCALGFHASAQFIALQLGGLVDSDLVFYKNMRETTHPEWVPGFGWIKDKKLGYYFEHPDLLNVLDYIQIGKGQEGRKNG